MWVQDSRESTKAYFITRTQPNVWICSTWKWMFKITSAANISWPRLWSFTIVDCQGASKWFNSGKSVISSLSNLFPGGICCHIGAVAFDLYHYTVILEQKIGLQLHIGSQVINWICWLIPTAYICFFNIKAVITYSGGWDVTKIELARFVCPNWVRGGYYIIRDQITRKS